MLIMPNPTPIAPGTVVGAWTVLSELPRVHRKKGRAVRCFLCRCTCGLEKPVLLIVMKRGAHCRKCADALRPRPVNPGTHRQTRTPTYRSWTSMRRRCDSPCMPSYPRYGGRGITVCDRWRDSFEAFIADMGERPSPDHSLDRIDNDGNYEPTNCRWATAKEQMRNRHNTHWITAGGETLSLAEWSERTGLPPGVITKRMERGLSPADAMQQPVDRTTELVTVGGVTKTLREWAAQCAVTEHSLRYRLRRGWPPERAVFVGRWPMRGPHSPETKAKLSAAMKGRPWSKARRTA